MASRSFDQLVSSYSPEVRTLDRRSQRFIRELIPKIEETVDTSGPYVSYGFGPGYKGVVCYMTISKTGVKSRNFSVDAEHIVVATNSPVNNFVTMHTKQHPYRL